MAAPWKTPMNCSALPYAGCLSTDGLRVSSLTTTNCHVVSGRVA